jgi:hypothetical protein
MMGKETMMTMKSTLLAALGVLSIAAPAAVQAQPADGSYYDRPDGAYYDNGYYPDDGYSYRHYRRGCFIGRRGEYGLFGRYRQRLTLICR